MKAIHTYLKMKEFKIVEYRFPSKLHAEFKARLFYDDMAMTAFIRSCVCGYLENNSHILEFIKEYKEKNKIQNKKNRKKNTELVEKGKNIEELFNFSKNEVKEIYDVIEENLWIKEEL